MLKFREKNYIVCLLDTCVISDFYEDSSIYQNFLEMLIQENILIAISISTTLELKKVSERYEWFKNEFTKLPAFLIKPTDLLLRDELDKYPYENNEKFLLEYLFEKKELLDFLDKSEKFQNAVQYVEKDKTNVLNSILSLKENFPPDSNGKYSTSRINEFLERVTSQQLETFFPDWTAKFKPTTKMDFSKFKSLRSQLLIAFWKFYLMKDRKAKKSDIFDITIVSALPYVDIVITEKNMKNDIDQIRNKGLFFHNLKAMTINEIKKPAPNKL